MPLSERIKKLRREYVGQPLSEAEVDHDPVLQFESWFEDALRAKIPDPHAMVLATVSASGTPSARVVLLRDFGKNGLVFFTNYRSRKGIEIMSNPAVAAVFFWVELDRQVRVEGRVKKVSVEESDKYFHSRPRESQLAAWASNQSEAIDSRAELEKLFKDFKLEFRGRSVPRPDYWGGFRIVPTSYEFWQGRANRLHDRVRYHFDRSGSWVIQRLAP